MGLFDRKVEVRTDKSYQLYVFGKLKVRKGQRFTLRYKVKKAKLKSAYTGAVEQVDAAFWQGLKPIGFTYSDWLNEQLAKVAPVDVECVCEGIADGGWPMVRFYLPS